MAASNLPPDSVLDRIRAEYRAEDAAESLRDTQLQFGSTWRETAALLWGDLMAAAIDQSTAPTALRIEGV